jgi:hypothetical protein
MSLPLYFACLMRSGETGAFTRTMQTSYMLGRIHISDKQDTTTENILYVSLISLNI